MNFVFAMFFTFVSGNIAVAVLGVIFSASISSVLISISQSLTGSPGGFWVGYSILIIAMYKLNKQIFKRREAEKLNKLFMFRWAEIMFTICVVANIMFVLNAIAIPYTLTIVEFIPTTLLGIFVYMMLELFFVTGYNKAKIKAKVKPVVVLIPIAISIIVYIFFVFRIYDLFN